MVRRAIRIVKVPVFDMNSIATQEPRSELDRSVIVRSEQLTELKRGRLVGQRRIMIPRNECDFAAERDMSPQRFNRGLMGSHGCVQAVCRIHFGRIERQVEDIASKDNLGVSMPCENLRETTADFTAIVLGEMSIAEN
jgi:hypothetical protein